MDLAGSFDVIIGGSGIAGSVLAGVLARSGMRVLVAEKEPAFRDRVRGEGIYHWGLIEARRLGVEQLFEQADGVSLKAIAFYENQELATIIPWAPGGGDELSATAFAHPTFQEIAWAWAQSQGATMRRATKIVDFSSNGTAAVTVVHDGSEQEVHARLLVAADGKHSQARRWTGGRSESDPEDHRFGGVAVAGVRTADRDTDNMAGAIGGWVNWFARGSQTTRLYLSLTAEKLRASGAHRSFAALLAFAAPHMPAGALDEVQQAGPVGFFPNSDTWATRISGEHLALIGDAAGSPDPNQGHGTSLAIRDVRELSDLLLADDDWPAATAEYEVRRRAYFDVIRHGDLWHAALEFETGAEADRLRAGHDRAAEADPTLGGFGVLPARGPDGLTADAAARDRFFGAALV